jgi:hypothetical protein
MKTIIAYIFLSVFTLSCVYGQIIEEKERELFKSVGVKERTKIDYKFTNNVQAQKGVKTSVSLYNKEGLALKTYTYNGKGEVVVTETNSYDEHNNRIFYERKSASGAYKKTSEYDSEDKVILESGYDGSATFKTLYKYDSKQRVLEIAYYAENLLDEKRVYKYEGSNATVQILHKGKDLKSTIYLKYNSANQIIEEKAKSLTGVELEKRIIEYNAKGLIIKEEKYHTGTLSYRHSYVYDAKGELVKLSEESTSSQKFDKKLYKYDSNGRIIEYKWTKKPGQDYNIKTYKYDAKGSCTEELTFYPATKYKLRSKYEYKFY